MGLNLPGTKGRRETATHTSAMKEIDLSTFTKRTAAAVAAAALVAGLAGCSSTGPADNGKATIEWGFWDQGSSNDTWKALAEQVSTENPDLSVKLTTSPFADYFTKLQSQLAAGTTPCI